MHQWFTWGDLISWLVIIALVYYAGWFIVFGAHRKTKKVRTTPAVWSRATASDLAEPPVAAAPSPMSLVHDLIEELKAVWAAAKNEGLSKEQISSAIRHRLLRYQSLKGSALQASVNHHIIQECLTATTVQLTEEEISVLW